MANLFLASEILEINIAEEHNGAAFYQAVADVTKNKNLKKTLLEISAQEKIMKIDLPNYCNRLKSGNRKKHIQVSLTRT